MLDLAQGVREQIIKETAPKTVAPRRFTMRTLRRMAGMGRRRGRSLAARGAVEPQRSGRRAAGGRIPADIRPVKPCATADATRNSTQRPKRNGSPMPSAGSPRKANEMNSRLAAVEHGMDDVTGSVTKQIEAAAAAHRADEGPTVAATASISATMTPSAAMPPPGNFAAPATIQARMIGGVPAPPEIAYGVDIASGVSLEELRTRWTAIRNAHPQLFAGLEPIATVKEAPRGNRLELRLVVGPLAEAGDAAQLCTSLAAFGLFCQPAMFDGQRLASR